MNTIAYLLYGNSATHQLELSYSVASLMKLSRESAFQVKLLCDVRSARLDLPLENVVISDEVFGDWTRNGSYWHEAKVHALEFACQTFGGKVCLIDTDTAFLRSVSHIFAEIQPGTAIMHQFEGTLGTHELWQEPLAKLPDCIAGYQLNSDTPMYNSGVIGIDSVDSSILTDVINVIRQIDSHMKVFNTEQLVFSMVLNAHTQLTTAQDTIQHYWGFDRAFAHLQIRRYLGEGEVNVAELATTLPKLGMVGKRRRDTLRARLHLLRRETTDRYRFAYIAYLTALRTAMSDPALANVWADVALKILIEDRPDAANLNRDFPAFGNNELCGWMDEVSRERCRLLLEVSSPATAQ